MIIYCCGCRRDQHANPVMGAKIYPHRPDLRGLHMFQCTSCGNYVGAHTRGRHKGKPLGVIPTPELRRARKAIHDDLDPIWRKSHMSRDAVYAYLTDVLGREYHTADLRSMKEVELIRDSVTRLRVQQGLF